MGIVGGEELRTMPLSLRSVRRLSWLTVNIVLNILAASVIAFNQDTLSAVIALAVFLPIISDMSGCSGNQAVAVSLRELTLGIIRPSGGVARLPQRSRRRHHQRRRARNPARPCCLAWKGNLMLGGVVAIALAANTLVAVCFGGLIPLALSGHRSGSRARFWAHSNDGHRHVRLLHRPQTGRRRSAVADDVNTSQCRTS